MKTSACFSRARPHSSTKIYSSTNHEVGVTFRKKRARGFVSLNHQTNNSPGIILSHPFSLRPLVDQLLGIRTRTVELDSLH